MSCPFCGASLSATPQRPIARAAAALAMGLAATVTFGMTGIGCEPDPPAEQDGAGGASATSGSGGAPSDGSGNYTSGYAVVSTYGPPPTVGSGPPPPGVFLCENEYGVYDNDSSDCYGCLEASCCAPTLDCIEDSTCRSCLFGTGGEPACDATTLDEAVYACLGASCRTDCGLELCNSGIHEVAKTECRDCLEAACCTDYVACGNDADCVACINGGDPAACELTTLDEDLIACRVNGCAAACGDP